MNARSSSLRAALAITRWKRVSAIRNGSEAGSLPSASAIAASSCSAVSSVACWAARPASGTSIEMRASTQLHQRDVVGLEHHRDRLADVAAHALALRARDEDPAARPLRRADQMRAREQAQPFAQRRPADAELGRELLLRPQALARPQVALREVAPDLERDLLAGVPARSAETRARCRHGANISSGATSTSSRSGSSRAARPGSTSSSSASSSAWSLTARAGQPNARAMPRDVDGEGRPGRRAAVLLGEPVHDRVAAVGEDHEERRRPGSARRSTAPGSSTSTIRRRRSRRRAGRGAPCAGRSRPGSAKPSPPIAGLSEPSDSRAGSRSMQLGPARGRLLDHDRVARDPLRDRREDVSGAHRLARRGRRRRGGTRAAPVPHARAAVRARASSAQTDAGAREHGELGRAAMHLGRVAADHRDARARLDERALDERVLPERPARPRRARHHAARASRAGARDRPAGALRTARDPGESGAGAERLLPDRAAEPLGERDERPPRLGIVGARRRPRAPGSAEPRTARRAASTAPPSAVRGAHDAARSRALAAAAASAAQSSIGTITSAGPLPVTDSCTARAIAPGTSCGAHGLVDPHRVLAREALQLAGEERLGCEMAPVLLPHDDHERRTVDARGGQCADRVAEPGGRVQDRERGLAAPDRPARRHADDRALVQGEHEAEVVRQVGEQPDLGRPRVGEDRGQAVLAPDVEGRLADRLDSHGHSLRK